MVFFALKFNKFSRQRKLSAGSGENEGKIRLLTCLCVGFYVLRIASCEKGRIVQRKGVFASVSSGGPGIFWISSFCFIFVFFINAVRRMTLSDRIFAFFESCWDDLSYFGDLKFKIFPKQPQNDFLGSSIKFVALVESKGLKFCYDVRFFLWKNCTNFVKRGQKFRLLRYEFN